MSAGTGVLHSEVNPSRDRSVHLLQIWLLPDRRGLKPEYEQKTFLAEERAGRLRLVASPDGSDGSLTLHQDARILAGTIRDSVQHDLQPGRFAWLQVARGSLDLNGKTLNAGDGAAIENEPTLTLRGKDAEVLLFDLN
jgi:redox-sensitive bicupin YhaK (pirin superfamily)